jgi:hypothetical protein
MICQLFQISISNFSIFQYLTNILSIFVVSEYWQNFPTFKKKIKIFYVSLLKNYPISLFQKNCKFFQFFINFIPNLQSFLKIPILWFWKISDFFQIFVNYFWICNKKMECSNFYKICGFEGLESFCILLSMFLNL